MSVSSVRDRRRAGDRRGDQGGGAPGAPRRRARRVLPAGVARAVGMTVQSDYFANRDALLLRSWSTRTTPRPTPCRPPRTPPGRHPHERRLAACQAFREWALANRPAFLLLYGTAPGVHPAGRERRRAGGVAARAVVRRGRLRRVDARAVAAVPAAPGLVEADLGKMALPLGAAALFIELRARMQRVGGAGDRRAPAPVQGCRAALQAAINLVHVHQGTSTPASARRPLIRPSRRRRTSAGRRRAGGRAA